MNIKELLIQLNNELKKESPDKNAIISHINRVVAGYNELINSRAASSQTEGEVEALRKEIAQSEKKYKKKVIDLYTIFEISKDLNSSLNIDNLINTIILTSLGHLLAENGSIFVLQEKRGQFLFRLSKGIRTGIEGIRFDAEEELIRYVKSHPRPFSRQDFLAENKTERYEQVFRNLNCELIVPFLIKNKLNGILFLGPKSGNIPFTESNIEFLTALANFAAIALENAKLYTDLDNKVRDLSALYNISREINKSDRTSTVLDLMLETITTGFGATKCSLILYQDLKDAYSIERNHNIEQALSEKYLKLILDGKVENALEKGGPVHFADKALLGDDIFFSVPLVAGSKKVGLLNIYRFEDRIILDEDLMQIFSIIASQMAPPIIATFYVSKSEAYRESPYDYIYNAVQTTLDRSRESGISSVLCRLKVLDGGLDFGRMKILMDRIRPVLQSTDSLIHAGFNELLLIFSVSTKEEVENLINDVIKNMAQIDRIEYKTVTLPDEGEDTDSLLRVLYGK